MRRIDDILSRIKAVYGVQMDVELQHTAGIRPNTISNWKERDSIPYKQLDEISQNEGISFDWLLYGRGEKQSSGNLPVAKATQEFIEDSIMDMIGLRYYPDIYAAAGYGSINESECEYQIMHFDRTFLEEFMNIRRFKDLDIIKVMGDSMEPYIQDGQLVLIERNSDARNGETVIANINGEVVIKRFHADPVRRSWAKLVSDNNSYEDITFNTPEEMSMLSIVGIVRAKIKVF